MLKFKELILLIFIILIVVSIFGKPMIERFIATRGRRHAVMNENGGIMYVSNKQPYQLGDYSCAHAVCPAVFEKDVMCWKCRDDVAEPQLN